MVLKELKNLNFHQEIENLQRLKHEGNVVLWSDWSPDHRVHRQCRSAGSDTGYNSMFYSGSLLQQLLKSLE